MNGGLQSVLMVCTGNICRSPIAEMLLRDRLADRGCSLGVSSAGTGARNGYGIHRHAGAVLADHGIDSRAFSSRYLQAPHLRGADVVLTMTRAHRQVCQKMVPARWKRVFTLVEFVDLIAIGRRDESVDQATIEDLMALRNRVDPEAEHLDIADPIGCPPEAFVDTFTELAPRIESVAGWLMGDR